MRVFPRRALPFSFLIKKYNMSAFALRFSFDPPLKLKGSRPRFFPGRNVPTAFRAGDFILRRKMGSLFC
ncbi:hypothetical protein HMPREF7215_1038 [Pyramidobacter piscolens W5455]|uniref:Uncharacterized protein n=1 Tax=Pyramidobacter piscolens W5455 TaxID=352165 RepID=A0ABM9ZRV9_9BACT|nr:hypothetical protein HMPREF7215_1038 [Pyramidobacter piscolens W5455]